MKKEEFCILLRKNEPEPLKLAVHALVRDFAKVMDFEPEIVDLPEKTKGKAVIYIVNIETKNSGLDSPSVSLPDTDGFESHGVFIDTDDRTIYLYGYDLRGTVYAVYTFSERFLGVPPLWYFCSWVPQKKTELDIRENSNLSFSSPQVRFRAWFPNDTDMFSPWRKLSEENDTMWLETMLRLKLNTVELGTTISYPDRMSTEAGKLARFGLILTSHHMIALNSGFANWGRYWENVRKIEPPELLLSNEKEIIEFYRYNIETVKESGMENLWQIAFRGDGDKPFWATFKDAPETDPERAEVINRMLQIQLDLIREMTGEAEPYVRITFYDELSDFLASGLLKPPQGANVIRTFCSARRDHYPNDDIVRFDTNRDVKLGYYMNLQFTSTGSHLAPAEGPWKMEANYRYVNSKAPLCFSVLNAGNLREHLLSLSAGAAMHWNFDAYNTDRFLFDYCKTYFGAENAGDVADLYKSFFQAYWEPTRPSFPGMQRQFLFHDLRHARAIRMIAGEFSRYDPNPLKEIGFERVPGRSFRITPSDNGAATTVDAILNGMKTSSMKFEKVARRCGEIIAALPEDKRLFFNDNLRGYAWFMHHLSNSLHDFTKAYKNRDDRESRVADLERAVDSMKSARQSLLETQHGVFDRWYDGDANKGKFNMPETIDRVKKTLRQSAEPVRL